MPGTEYLARKKVLSTVLNRMSRYFPAHFDFVPKEFLLPEEEFELRDAVEDEPRRWWIAKPSKGCGGEGIFLHRGYPNLPETNQDFVIQHYISNPLLLDKKKFDL